MVSHVWIPCLDEKILESAFATSHHDVAYAHSQADGKTQSSLPYQENKALSENTLNFVLGSTHPILWG